MKVLMLGWELPPHNSGGLGVACYQLCKSLANSGASIDFIVPVKEEHSSLPFMRVHSVLPGTVTHRERAGAYDSYKYIFSDDTEQTLTVFEQQELYEESIGRIVESIDFDIIHAHDWLTFKAGLRAKQLTGKPLIAHIHALESDRSAQKGGGNPLVRDIEESVLHIADLVVAVSEHTKNCIIEEYGVPADKIAVVHNSIDHEMIPLFDNDSVYQYLIRMKQNGYKVVTNVARLTVQKGFYFFLRTAAAVIKSRPKTLFLIVGSGELRDELIMQAADYGIGRNVLFVDFVRGKHFYDTLKVTDLFFAPSVSEPFGLAQLEAAGYHTAVLVSKQSGVSEVLKNCIKVDFWDVDEMTRLTLEILNDTNKFQQMALSLREEYLHTSWQDSARKLMAHYHRYTEKNRGTI